MVEDTGWGERRGSCQHPQRWFRGWGVRCREDGRSEHGVHTREGQHNVGGRQVVCQRRCQQRKDAAEVLQSSVVAVGEQYQRGARGRVVERVHNVLEAHQDQIVGLRQRLCELCREPQKGVTDVGGSGVPEAHGVALIGVKSGARVSAVGAVRQPSGSFGGLAWTRMQILGRATGVRLKLTAPCN
jgi:hypothetical protein